MLELHAVKVAKAVHKKTTKLAMTCLGRRERKALKQKQAADRYAVDLRMSAEQTIDYARELQQNALARHAERNKRITEAKKLISE